LPDSVTVAQQVRSLSCTTDLRVHMLHLQWDDRCKNGFNTFSVRTATYERRGDSEPLQFYCNEQGQQVPLGLVNRGSNLLDDTAIAAHFPGVAALVAYRLMAPHGPLHYFVNTTYMAGDRDCWGYRKDEQRRARDSGLPLWRLSVEQARALGHTCSLVAAAEKPCAGAMPWLMDGKEHELASARRSAVWPEATDEDLCLPKEVLEQLLHARLPGVVQDFRRHLESAGLAY
jgi:hypothetical protein